MRSLITIMALGGAALAAPSLRADDRPFLRTVTAVVEDDDERVFEFSATGLSHRHGDGLSLQGGYSFSPTLSIEGELGLSRDRAEGSKGWEAGIGVWQAWIDPAREGWGLAGKLGAEWDRDAAGEPQQRTLRGVIAASLPLSSKQVWLHANAGVEQREGEGRAGIWSLALQGELDRRWALFGEIASSSRRDELAQVGVRHWFKRGKLALDLAIGLERIADDRRGFVAAGLAFYDLDLHW
jgi:hypothetical protein